MSFGTKESKTGSALPDRWVGCDCLAGYEPGIVLDPFMGSGTSAVCARQQRRRFIGSELKPEHIEIAKRPLDQLHLNIEGGVG